MDAIRSALQPITTNLPPPIKQLGISIIGDKCYTRLIEEIDPSDHECLKLAVSKALGIGIIAASSIVKIPQILKLINSRSASGVSLLSTLLETTGYIISVAYNFRQGFPFSTFGETALIVIQNVIIAVLIMQFSNKGNQAAGLVAGLGAAGYALFQKDVIPEQAMKGLQACTIPLSLASKVPQIWTVWKNGSTGQLSAFAVFNFLAGSLARVFTTLQEVDDPLILYGFVGGAVLNFILAAQMVFYWNASTPTTKKKKSRSTKKSTSKALAEKGSTATSTTGAATAPGTAKKGRASRQSSVIPSGTPPRTRSKGNPDIDMDAAIASSGGEKPMTPKTRRKKRAA